RRVWSRGCSGLFTGANFASRSFELAVILGGAGAAASVLAFPLGTASTPFTTWPLGVAVALAAIPGIALAGAFPLSFGQKMYLNLGSAVASGLLLVLPPPQRLATAFGGMLAGQLVRRSRGYRLTIPTIVFNQAQYVATWALVVLTNARLRAGARPSSRSLRQIAPFLAALVETAERRSFENVEHSERVSWWAERLARHVGVPESEADAIAVAAKLHDLGKIALGVPIGEDRDDGADAGPFHPNIAGDLLRRVPGLEGAARYLRAQAEWYDGSGSPDHLAGETIPLASRIIAVADAYDLALEHGPGAAGDGHERALARVRGRAGTQFDPGIVAALEALVSADVSRDASMGTRRTSPGDVRGPLLAAAGVRGGFPAAAGHAWTDRILRLEALRRVHPQATPQSPAPEAGGLPTSLLIVEQQEEERRRIARELHDEVGGTLTWLRCTLRTLPDLPAVREAQSGIDALTTQIRNISVDLRPPALDDLGLAAALVRHTQRYTSVTGIRVNL